VLTHDGRDGGGGRGGRKYPPLHYGGLDPQHCIRRRGFKGERRSPSLLPLRFFRQKNSFFFPLPVPLRYSFLAPSLLPPFFFSLFSLFLSRSFPPSSLLFLSVFSFPFSLLPSFLPSFSLCFLFSFSLSCLVYCIFAIFFWLFFGYFLKKIKVFHIVFPL
jgi:hypothetical protein